MAREKCFMRKVQSDGGPGELRVRQIGRILVRSAFYVKPFISTGPPQFLLARLAAGSPLDNAQVVLDAAQGVFDVAPLRSQLDFRLIS